MKKILFTIVFMSLFSGCALNQQTETATFAVYLADSNEVIFSEDDIISYEPSIQTFTFTLEGAKKMKSYQPSLQIDGGLHQKPFVAKLGNKEIYEGKFWTNLSSLSEPGIVMSDIVMVGPDFNTLTVNGAYPPSELKGSDKIINNKKLVNHFKSINKFK